MDTYEVPCWMIGTWRGKESDYYFYGSGRTLGFVRMAAAVLTDLGVEQQKEAEYHAYADSGGPHHQDSGEAKIRESTGGGVS